ncbi:hypothetical protein HELRODRAFT_68567, partial [Helobdella robusta]|uniref:DM10 domain-containing protein n=1 Tax=Helobdella robusta TaxID=6412 RepID=T1FZG7_HELRO
DKYAFIVEWYDIQAALIRRYILTYYNEDCAVELFDMKTRKMFLKRVRVKEICLNDLIIGNIINVMSRPMKIIDYADLRTKRHLGKRDERTMLLIKPDAYEKVGTMINDLYAAGYIIRRMKSFQLNTKQAADFYIDFLEESDYRSMFIYLASGPVIVMELIKENAFFDLCQLVGHLDPNVARTENPNSFRARFGIDKLKNAIHCPATGEKVRSEIDFFFATNNVMNTVTYKNSTCVVVKPHAIDDGQAGYIIECIQNLGYRISAYLMCTFDKVNAEEFYEVYKGVVPEYPKMVDELSRGLCLAMEVKLPDETLRTAEETTEPFQNCQQHMNFRDVVGPSDPELARKIRPNTLRAKFGMNKILNSIHCTDLPEDTVIELEYFFKIVDNK